jgi:lysozyme
MRAPSIILAAAALLALALSRKSETTEPARGDESEPVDVYDPALDWYPMGSSGTDEPVYDPRDVMARRRMPGDFKPSARLREWLKAKERLTLNRYELGDGGVTIGYGHYEPYSRANLIPESITIDEAERLFDEDIESRAARWVRLYVRIPVTQNEFDALTSLAFNLSPGSFKRIADALNEGRDWKAIALEYTRPGTNLEKGLLARREKEFAMFDQATYA